MASPDVAGPSFIALQVRDVPRAADFYEQRLGLRRAGQSPSGAVVFATEPVAFAVREAAPDVDLSSGPAGLGVALWLASADAQGLHDDLAEDGVVIRTAPFDGPFGRTFAFEDPDGYVITVHDAR